MLLTGTWTAGVRAGISKRSLLLSPSVSSSGNPEYEQQEKGHGCGNGEVRILAVQGRAGGSLFPEPGLLASWFQTAKYSESSVKMYFYSSIIPCYLKGCKIVYNDRQNITT